MNKILVSFLFQFIIGKAIVSVQDSEGYVNFDHILGFWDNGNYSRKFILKFYSCKVYCLKLHEEPVAST